MKWKEWEMNRSEVSWRTVKWRDVFEVQKEKKKKKMMMMMRSCLELPFH